MKIVSEQLDLSRLIGLTLLFSLSSVMNAVAWWSVLIGGVSTNELFFRCFILRSVII